MRILLLNPPYIENIYSGFRAAVQVQLSLGLAYIAAVLEEEEQEVKALDANAEGFDVAQTVEWIAASDCEVVGITSTTAMISKVEKIAEGVKEKTDKKVIVGGPHITFLPKEIMEGCKSIDIAVLGEGEDTIRELIHKGFKDLNSVQGIAFRDKGVVVVNERRERIQDLDKIAFPARHLFNHNLYKIGCSWNIGMKDKECATVITSRGCPSRCSYCSSLSFWGSRVRFRSVKNIIQEIELLREKYGVKQLAILDDTFLANKKRVEEFCDKIIARGIHIHWWCYAHLATLYTKELFRKMRKAGCFGLFFGVESGNQAVLNRAHKNIKLERTEETIRLAKKEGFMVQASFMIGLPGDTVKTVKETIDFAIRLNLHVAQFCITTPFPGTELYSEAKEKGWFKAETSWADMGIHQKTKFRNDDLTSKQIYELYVLAHKKFYFRISYFWLLFKRLVRHPREIKGFILAGIYVITKYF